MTARLVKPGWYGFDIDSGDLAAWEAFRRANGSALRQRKTWDRSRSELSIAFLLEVTAPLEWTYPGGLPMPAPKGAATQLQDLTGEPDVSPSLPNQVEEWGSAVASAAGSGTRLIVFGLGAVALLALLRKR
jgi:hypothetical protein